MAPRRYRTPAGVRVDVISLSLTGGPGGPHSRDGGVGGDGEWIRVKHPNGIMIGLVRTPDELAALGVDLADLEEVPDDPVRGFGDLDFEGGEPGPRFGSDEND